ncbi:tetratricopeptide repeat protein [uncultured Sphingomonas sp.]|uniref:tetratricopeptide repeat protein n=1 Tax=uncultured Sphingomonas sp. TaxID=158754 RepID=UPI0025DBF85D|nr:tetratricopeptide repeat protein [uncultured Sphingomonas sp.]
MAEAIADRGSAHYRAGRYALALADYRSAVAHGDDSSAIWFNQGLANEAIGETLAAIRDYTVALDRDPDNIDAHLYRGILALNTGNLQVALNDFDAVLRARPGNVDARANRGLTHVWRGNADLARADFSAVRAAGSQHPAMLHGEAVLALRAGDGDTALSHLDTALRADPNDRWALERRSAIFRSLGDRAKAAVDLEQLHIVERAEYRRQYEH